MTVAAGTVTYFPTNVEIEQEYWQSLSYLPSTAQAGSDKIKARVYNDKTQAMPKLGRSRYADATDARTPDAKTLKSLLGKNRERTLRRRSERTTSADGANRIPD